jgi:hypothetical protein
MFDAKRITRTIILAGTLAALAAPTAAARVADAQRIDPPAANSAASSSERTGHASGLAETVTRRETIANEAWQRANPPTTVTIPGSDDGSGFDLQSAGIGAAVALTLTLLTIMGKRTPPRRRVSNVRDQLANGKSATTAHPAGDGVRAAVASRAQRRGSL